MPTNPHTLHAIRSVMNRQGYIDIPSSGASMLPFIHAGNICRFVSSQPSQLQQGDIILFVADTGNLVGHRLIDKKYIERDWLIICKGDSNIYPDAPITADQIIGRMVSIRGAVGHRNTSGYWMRLWGKCIIRLPQLSMAIQAYLKIIKKWRGMKKRLWAS